MGNMLTKEWFFSGKVLTIIILIIFPVVYMLLVQFGYLALPTIDLPPLPQLKMIVSIPIPTFPIPLLVVLAIFAMYPTLYSTPRFFEKRGFENVVIEYNYMKKILFVAIAILIIFVPVSVTLTITLYDMMRTDPTIKELTQQVANRVTTILNQTGNISQKELASDKEFMEIAKKMNSVIVQKFPFYQLLLPINLSLFIVVPISITITFKLLLERGRMLFKLYLAKAYFRIILNDMTSEIDRARYFKTGLMWYNRFLKDTINLKINNIDTFYESVLIGSPLNGNTTLLSLANAFEDKSRFEPLRVISGILPKGEGQKILTTETLTTRIKESIDLIIPIVTIIITVITTFFIKPL